MCTFGGAFNVWFSIEGFTCQEVIVTFLISGGAFGVGRGLQRRLRSWSILYAIFESSNLARVSCFLMLLGVLKATVGLFGKSLESSGDFSTRCQYLACIFSSEWGRGLFQKVFWIPAYP